MLEVKSVVAEAQKELNEEQIKKAKESLKKLYRQKQDAEQVVKNIDRQIADYLAEIGHGNI